MMYEAKELKLNIQNMSFKRPVKPGTILNFEARVVLAGKTSFIVAVSAADALSGEKAIEGMLTFVTVDEPQENKPSSVYCIFSKCVVNC